MSNAQRLKYKKRKRPYVVSVNIEKLGKKMSYTQPSEKIISEWDRYQKRYGKFRDWDPTALFPDQEIFSVSP